MNTKMIKIGGLSLLLLGSFLLRSQEVVQPKVSPKVRNLAILIKRMLQSEKFDKSFRQEMLSPQMDAPMVKFINAVILNQNPNNMIDPTIYFMEETGPQRGYLYQAGRAVTAPIRVPIQAVWGGIKGTGQRVYRAGTERRVGALWEKGVGVVCSQFEKYPRPFLTLRPQYDSNQPELSQSYNDFLVQLLLLAQHKDKTCWNNTIRFVQRTYENNKDSQVVLFALMIKSALLQYTKLLRSYQLAKEQSEGITAKFKYYSSKLADMLRDPVSLYFVGAAVKALYEVSPEYYRRFAGDTGLTQEEKDQTSLNKMLLGYLGDKEGPQGQEALVFAREQADRIRFEAESTWFQRHKWKVYVVSVTATALAVYLIWKGFDEIRSDYGAAQGFWAKAGVAITAPVYTVARGVAQIGKTGYKQLEAAAGVIKTKAGEFYARTPDVRGRIGKPLLEKAQRAWGGIKSGFGRVAGYFRRTPAGELPIGTEVVVPAGDVSPETPVIAPVENVEPDAMVEPVGEPMVTTEILEEQGV